MHGLQVVSRLAGVLSTLSMSRAASPHEGRARWAQDGIEDDRLAGEVRVRAWRNVQFTLPGALAAAPVGMREGDRHAGGGHIPLIDRVAWLLVGTALGVAGTLLLGALR